MPNNAPFFNFQNRVKFTGGAELKSQAKKRGLKPPFFKFMILFSFLKSAFNQIIRIVICLLQNKGLIVFQLTVLIEFTIDCQDIPCNR